MKLAYTPPYLYCDEYVADTMIASCGNACNAVGGEGAADGGFCMRGANDCGYQYGADTGCSDNYPTHNQWYYCWGCTITPEKPEDCAV